MQQFDEQTLKDLEFNTIKDWLTKYAIGETTQKRILSLKPSNNFPFIKYELNQLNEFHNIRIHNERFPALDFEELKNEIKLLGIRNSVLPQEGFHRLKQASYVVNQIIIFFDKREKDYPILNKLLTKVYHTNQIIEAIDKIFDRSGKIKNDASTLLTEIRSNLSTVRKKINKNFERELRKLSKENILGEIQETFINERRVLSIVSTHKRKVSGSVLGSSKSGSLTFIEPSSNIDLNNEYELLLDDERKEIFRILQQLTSDIAHLLPLIESYQELLCEFDFINAKSKLGFELNCCLPAVVDQMRLELINVVHPILWKNNKNAGKSTQSQYISMDYDSRILVISGPNAGGKSITLKTIGLIQLMLQSGLLVPLDPNSKICLFQQVLSDIGDNQSIENELSTYSYRLKRMNHFLKVANRRTLLLLDEFGTGSDPELGGALAEVFFEELYNKKSYGVVTTHYANIKLKADKLKNAINGCMLFDTETLAPLFKFSIGQPGSSFTFEVAQVNGIDLNLIEKAKSKLNQKKVKMDHLLAELQKEKTYLNKLVKEHIKAQEIAQKAKNNYELKNEKLGSKMKIQQDLIEKNNKLISLGKKLQHSIDQFKVRTRKKDANKIVIDDLIKYINLEKNKIESLKMAEKAKKIELKKTTFKSKQNKNKSIKDEYQRNKIIVGSTVKLIATKQTGTVEEIKGNNITVTFGFLKMKVSIDKLMFIK